MTCLQAILHITCHLSHAGGLGIAGFTEAHESYDSFPKIASKSEGTHIQSSLFVVVIQSLMVINGLYMKTCVKEEAWVG